MAEGDSLLQPGGSRRMLQEDDRVGWSLQPGSLRQVSLTERCDIFSDEDSAHRRSVGNSFAHLRFKFTVGDQAFGTGDGDEGNQISTVALRLQLFSQEWHDGGNGSVQNGTPPGMDQVQPMLKDKYHHLSGEDSCLLISSLPGGSPAEQIAVGNGKVRFASQKEGEGSLIGGFASILKQEAGEVGGHG